MAEPRFHLGRHARNRLRWYRGTRFGMTPEDMYAIVVNPDAVRPSISGRLNAWRDAGDYWIRVTFREDRGSTVVITVTVKDRGPEAQEPQT